MGKKKAIDTQPAKDIRVLVCRVNAAPVVEHLVANKPGDYLAAMQAIVGGFVTSIVLDDGVELWCNDEGKLRRLPLNRVIPTVAPALPPGFEEAFVIRLGEDLALPGEPGEWRIHGDFFLAREDEDGQVTDVTDSDIARYMAMWPN